MLFCSASGVARSAPALAGSAGPEGLLDLIPVDVTTGILSAMACRGAEQAVVVVDKHMIRNKYLSRWFAIDCIGAFPGDTSALGLGLGGRARG